MKRVRAQPPRGAPEGTIRFGGPVDRCRVSLRVAGESLDPSEITSRMKVEPTFARLPGRLIHSSDGTPLRIDQVGSWHFTVGSGDLEELRDQPSDIVEGVIRNLLDRLPADLNFWKGLTGRYSVDLFCGLFLYSENRGFSLSPEICSVLGERGIDFEAPDDPAEPES